MREERERKRKKERRKHGACDRNWTIVIVFNCFVLRVSFHIRGMYAYLYTYAGETPCVCK